MAFEPSSVEVVERIKDIWRSHLVLVTHRCPPCVSRSRVSPVTHPCFDGVHWHRKLNSNLVVRHPVEVGQLDGLALEIGEHIERGVDFGAIL